MENQKTLFDVCLNDKKYGVVKGIENEEDKLVEWNNGNNSIVEEGKKQRVMEIVCSTAGYLFEDGKLVLPYENGL